MILASTSAYVLAVPVLVFRFSTPPPVILIAVSLPCETSVCSAARLATMAKPPSSTVTGARLARTWLFSDTILEATDGLIAPVTTSE